MKYRSQSAPRNRSSSNETELEIAEKKITFLMGRTSLLEDKCRKSEKLLKENREFDVKDNETIQHLLDDRKSDRKVILSLKENQTKLKSQIELLIQRDEIREKTIHRPQPGLLQSIDTDSLKEVIFQRVQQDFNVVLKEVVKACASEQATFLSNWAEKEKLERENFFQSSSQGNIKLSAALEREVLRMNAELQRSKLRQDSLESSFHELKQLVSTRQEDLNRLRATTIQACKDELENVVENVAKNMNDSINHLQGSVGNLTQQLNEVKLNHDKLFKAFQGQGKLIGNIAEKQNRDREQDCSRLDNMERSVVTLSTDQSTVKDTISTVIERQQEDYHQISLLTNHLCELNQSFDASRQQVDSQREKLEDQISLQVMRNDALTKEVQSIADTGKKTRSKCRELSASIANVQQTRKLTDQVLMKLEEQMTMETQQSSINSITSTRLERLEEELQIIKTVGPTTVAHEQLLQASTTIQWAEIKNEIANLKKELQRDIANSVDNLRVHELFDAVAGMKSEGQLVNSSNVENISAVEKVLRSIEDRQTKLEQQQTILDKQFVTLEEKLHSSTAKLATVSENKDELMSKFELEMDSLRNEMKDLLADSKSSVMKQMMESLDECQQQEELMKSSIESIKVEFNSFLTSIQGETADKDVKLTAVTETVSVLAEKVVNAERLLRVLEAESKQWSQHSPSSLISSIRVSPNLSTSIGSSMPSIYSRPLSSSMLLPPREYNYSNKLLETNRQINSESKIVQLNTPSSLLSSGSSTNSIATGSTESTPDRSHEEFSSSHLETLERLNESSDSTHSFDSPGELTTGTEEDEGSFSQGNLMESLLRESSSFGVTSNSRMNEQELGSPHSDLMTPLEDMDLEEFDEEQKGQPQQQQQQQHYHHQKQTVQNNISPVHQQLNDIDSLRKSLQESRNNKRRELAGGQ